MRGPVSRAATIRRIHQNTCLWNWGRRSSFERQFIHDGNRPAQAQILLSRGSRPGQRLRAWGRAGASVKTEELEGSIGAASGRTTARPNRFSSAQGVIGVSG